VLDNTGASRGQQQVAARIATSFTSIAGSDANALALVNGLRNGTPITLTTTTKPPAGAGSTPPSTTTTTTITPPTKPMGWGNVRIALALAAAELQQAGITKPTAAQLQAALTGGALKGPGGTTTQVQGVLTMRASGMGWGQIAQAQGTKVGPVLASMRHTQSQVAKLPVSSGQEPVNKQANAGTPKTQAATTTTRTTSTASPGGPSSKTLTTGNGTTKGVTTANGSPSSSHSSKGLTTATGAAAASGASKGIVTAEGAATNAGARTHSQGKGIVTAGGGAATNVASTAKPSGAGITTATGASVAGTGVTTASGGEGHGNGNGNGHGKGKGG
jgi:hypothetical protein